MSGGGSFFSFLPKDSINAHTSLILNSSHQPSMHTPIPPFPLEEEEEEGGGTGLLLHSSDKKVVQFTTNRHGQRGQETLDSVRPSGFIILGIWGGGREVGRDCARGRNGSTYQQDNQGIRRGNRRERERGRIREKERVYSLPRTPPLHTSHTFYTLDEGRLPLFSLPLSPAQDPCTP